MIADWIDAELRNWARWCHQGPWPHPIPPDRAASLEGQYSAPIIDDADADRGKPIPPNRRNAEIVHRVYLDRLTQRERWVLVWRYVKPIEDHVARRLIRINKREWEVALMAAARCVGEAFREARA